MPSQTEIQENITARIIEGLKNGIVPWKKPWRNDPNCGSAANVVSRRNYSGINPVLLDLRRNLTGSLLDFGEHILNGKNSVVRSRSVLKM